MGAAAAVPASVAGVSAIGQAMGSSGGKSRKSPIEKDLKLTARQALAQLRSTNFGGAANLATAGSQGYLGALASAGGPLSDLLATGSPVDVSGAVQSTEALARRNIEDQSRALQEQFASQGVRSGTDVMRASGLYRERATQDLNDQILRMVVASQEAARGRQLAAPGVASALYGGARSSGLDALFAGGGLQVPSRMPSGASEALANVTPSLLYALSKANYGGKGGGSASSGAGAGTDWFSPTATGGVPSTSTILN